jgi:hypothetical protein
LAKERQDTITTFGDEYDDSGNDKIVKNLVLQQMTTMLTTITANKAIDLILRSFFNISSSFSCSILVKVHVAIVIIIVVKFTH